MLLGHVKCGQGKKKTIWVLVTWLQEVQVDGIQIFKHGNNLV
jgi:hypothetical protein